MKVVLIYRKAQSGAFSIEELFRTIARELREQLEVVEFELSGRGILADARRLRRLEADVYHITGDVNYLALLLPWRKVVLTVHDIGHYLYGLKGLKRWLYKWLWLMAPTHLIGAVTAVSAETRAAMVRHLGLSGDRITVIENCHNPRFRPVPKTFDRECPTILQVGTRPYKNVPRVVEALRGVACRLVLVGPLDRELQDKLAECGVAYDNKVDLSHEEVYQEYLKADLVTFVSLGEGFGVPIIEAQATGRPLITAKRPPMCDVAGEGACLADPLEVGEIRAGIHRILTDDGYRDQLVAAGLQNAARYSPQAIAGRYLDLYRRLVNR